MNVFCIHARYFEFVKCINTFILKTSDNEKFIFVSKEIACGYNSLCIMYKLTDSEKHHYTVNAKIFV